MTSKSIFQVHARFIIFSLIVFVMACNKPIEDTPQYGRFEVSFESINNNPSFQFPQISFYKPNGSIIKDDGFFDGDNKYIAHAYCNKPGLWRWEIHPDSNCEKRSGTFNVVKSELKGKLKVGVTKIRAWFNSSRFGMEALFDEAHTTLNLSYWQEINHRVAYAFGKYPNLILKLLQSWHKSEMSKISFY